MKKTFLMATIDRRIEGFCDFVASAKRYFDSGFDMVAVCQGHTLQQQDFIRGRTAQILGTDDKIHFIFSREMLGCYGSKMLGLKEHESDYYISVDDDMLVIPETHWDKMLSMYRCRREFGTITGEMCKSYWYKKYFDRIQIQNTMSYRKNAVTGGGLLFSKEMRDLFLSNDKGRNKNYYYDDYQWGIETYASGLLNGRFFGSLLIHDTFGSNGFKDFKKSGKGQWPDHAYINYTIETVEKGGIQLEKAVGSEGGLCEKDYSQYLEDLFLKNKRLRDRP